MWFKVDDHFHDHEKVRGIDPAAAGVWALAGSWCGQAKTDGFVPDHVVTRWTRRVQKVAGELVDRELWEPAQRGREHGWQFVNWCEWQPTREETDEPLERIRWRRKNALKKDRGLCEQIVERDRSMCRYCGVRVKWQDRRGAAGGTYDHVDPDGPNSLTNVVVACRKCNGRKKDRTPQEAGMELLPEPGARTGSDLVPHQKEPGSIQCPPREAVRDQIGTGSDLVDAGQVEPGRVPALSVGEDEG